VYKNAIASMIVMLDYSEVNMEVSNTVMETANFNDCKKVSGNNEDTNGVLAMI